LEIKIFTARAQRRKEFFSLSLRLRGEFHNMTLPTILYVDDDRENLHTFRRLFRKEYTVLLAESGEQALELLKAHAPVPLIVTDQRMPEMTGIDFLERTREISPDSIRIIITGFTDVQALIDAINKGHVYRYITKPWEEQELFVTFKRAVESYELKVHNAQLLVELQQNNEALEASYHSLQAAQEQVVQAEKLASIGRLASRIAHELRNPIQAIRMGIEVLKQDLSAVEIGNPMQTACQTTLHHIDEEITAANTIVKDLLEYARDMQFEFTATDVNSLIDGALFNLSEKIAAAQVQVVTQYGDLALILADGIRLRQVMLNIIQNAIEAMSDGGTLTITTAPHDDTGISIVVQDTGCGMSPEQMARMFEPFFTTKEKGIGLGMSVVHRIIQAHNGKIIITSEPGHGTALTIVLNNAPGASEVPEM
jgi:two-component system, sensor histidine kinase and response regulator